MKIALLVLVVAVVASAAEDCQPFGVRTSFGSVFSDPIQLEKLRIMFNTKGNCPKSYVIHTLSEGVIKLQCQMKLLSLSAKVNNYKTYIHSCSLTDISYETGFEYNVFGWSGKLEDKALPFKDDFIPFKLINPQNKQKTVQMILLADWSFLKQKRGYYTPLEEGFRQILSSTQINGLIINGDVGYDLDSNNCLNYEEYIIMLSQIAAFVPTVHITGNHEYNTKDNYQLFVSSFHLHSLDTQLASTLHFGPFSLIMFDPYDILYGAAKESLQREPNSFRSLQALEAQFQKNNGNMVLTASHYPFVCSASAKFCQNDRTTLKDYWNLMFKNNVPLYLGAHYHTYERIYPYYQNGTFNKKQTTSFAYDYQNPTLLSILEGIAGNDDHIVEEYPKIESYTASLSFNQTGFGVISMSQSKGSYVHYTVKNGLHQTDQFEFVKDIRSTKLQIE